MTSTFNTLTLDYDAWRLGHAISIMEVRAAGIVKLYDKAAIQSEISKRYTIGSAQTYNPESKN